MGRRRTQLELTGAELREAQRLALSEAEPRTAERAAFALLGATGDYTLEELAVELGRQRSTLQQWLAKFRAGGLAGLLARETAPGLASPIATARVQRQLQAGLQAGRWTSAAHVAEWLQSTHGIRRSRKSIYYWFEKYGVPSPGIKTPTRRRAA